MSSSKPATNNSLAEVPVSVSFLSVLVSPWKSIVWAVVPLPALISDKLMAFVSVLPNIT
ncbi:hypothetical protein [Bathymodiolus thermophilus thioautotrophic gill symbiont]|uniref:hypothetical protein n=1 Tax=Bathymodiolus thermophilus thioautotrophic gill symbiont TaxID=2360 RepID=UPI00192C302E|nr:hypothetical protein [Bathymodiolus thermophilus thioautotrophic gill symbiont]